jgi:hypothetical protein
MVMIETEVSLGKLRNIAAINNGDYYSICLWCTTQFGKEAEQKDQIDKNHKWRTESVFGDEIFYFASQEDAIWFKLRWLGEQ